MSTELLPKVEKWERLIPYQFKRTDYEFDISKYKHGKTVDRELLLKDARKVAKATNQRLLRLEQADLTNSPAYRGAVKALKGLYSDHDITFGKVGKDGRPRYKERVNSLSNEELFEMLYTMSHTQQAKTSTPALVKQIFDKGRERVEKMVREQAGKEVKLSLNEYLYIFRSEALAQSMKLFGYKAVVQMVRELSGGTEGIKKQTPKQRQAEIESLAEKIAEATATKDNLIAVRKALGLKSKKTQINKNKWHRAT